MRVSASHVRCYRSNCGVRRSSLGGETSARSALRSGASAASPPRGLLRPFHHGVGLDIRDCSGLARRGPSQPPGEEAVQRAEDESRIRTRRRCPRTACRAVCRTDCGARSHRNRANASRRTRYSTRNRQTLAHVVSPSVLVGQVARARVTSSAPPDAGHFLCAIRTMATTKKMASNTPMIVHRPFPPITPFMLFGIAASDGHPTMSEVSAPSRCHVRSARVLGALMLVTEHLVAYEPGTSRKHRWGKGTTRTIARTG